MIQENFFGAPEPLADGYQYEPGAPARPAPQPAPDPEQLFFRAAARYLWWTWRLVHRAGAPFGTAQLQERRHDRAQQLAMLIHDLRSKRMQKDPNEYRAIFRHQKQAPHHLQIKIHAPVEIKIFQATRERWEAWYYDPAVRRATQPLRAIGGQSITSTTKEQLEKSVAEEFGEMVSPWKAFDPATGKMLETKPETAPK